MRGDTCLYVTGGIIAGLSGLAGIGFGVASAVAVTGAVGAGCVVTGAGAACFAIGCAILSVAVKQGDTSKLKQRFKKENQGTHKPGENKNEYESDFQSDVKHYKTLSVRQAPAAARPSTSEMRKERINRLKSSMEHSVENAPLLPGATQTSSTLFQGMDRQSRQVSNPNQMLRLKK